MNGQVGFGSHLQFHLKMKEDYLIFMNFGVKKFTVIKRPENKYLMFEHHNLMDPTEPEGSIIWGLFPRRQLQNPIFISLNHMFQFFEKMILPTLSKTASFCKNKYKEFKGLIE